VGEIDQVLAASLTQRFRQVVRVDALTRRRASCPLPSSTATWTPWMPTFVGPKMAYMSACSVVSIRLAARASPRNCQACASCPGVFDLAQRILTERGETIGRRAANPSDYDLTGLIICPQCGRKYIGTNATGRTRTYRYYTCFSRQRYGTNAGCDAHRFNAEALDAAIRQALIDFYTTGDDLIAQAVAEFQQAHQDSHADLRRELTGVEKELAKTQAAIDRYLSAFEGGTMDPAICQPRLTELAERAKQLRTRHTELAADLDHPPAAPSPAELRQVREHIRDILAHGTAQERKSLYEALIDHIEITNETPSSPSTASRRPATRTAPPPAGPNPPRAAPTTRFAH
jgi:site-specific DNA recombinase